MIGVIAGFIVSLIFRDKFPGFFPNAIIGVIGAFAGLFFKDVFDIQLAGNLGGAIIFSFLGALAVLLPTNLVYRRLFIG